MLHLIFNSPVDTSIFERLSANDHVLFLNDAVLCVLANGKIADLLREKANRIHFYALSEDIAVHGLTPEQLASKLKIIDYAGFVRLAAENPLSQSWC